MIRRRDGHYELTEKQREAVELADAGLTRREIAERLGIAKSTVDQRLEGARKWRRTQAIVAAYPSSTRRNASTT